MFFHDQSMFKNILAHLWIVGFINYNVSRRIDVLASLPHIMVFAFSYSACAVRRITGALATAISRISTLLLHLFDMPVATQKFLATKFTNQKRSPISPLLGVIPPLSTFILFIVCHNLYYNIIMYGTQGILYI